MQPDAWRAVELFALADDCWMRDQMGTPIEWDVSRAETVWRLAGETVAPAEFLGARVMARAACAALGERAARHRQKAEADAARRHRGTARAVRRR